MSKKKQLITWKLFLCLLISGCANEANVKLSYVLFSLNGIEWEGGYDIGLPSPTAILDRQHPQRLLHILATRPGHDLQWFDIYIVPFSGVGKYDLSIRDDSTIDNVMDLVSPALPRMHGTAWVDVTQFDTISKQVAGTFGGSAVTDSSGKFEFTKGEFNLGVEMH